MDLLSLAAARVFMFWQVEVGEKRAVLVGVVWSMQREGMLLVGGGTGGDLAKYPLKLEGMSVGLLGGRGFVGVGIGVGVGGISEREEFLLMGVVASVLVGLGE